MNYLSSHFVPTPSKFSHSEKAIFLQTKHSFRRRISVSISAVQSGVQKEDIVIVGAGIAGLATAVSLHRLGVRAVVLEQSESLRTSGTSLTLFKNGWSVLDALGVADELRPQFLEVQRLLWMVIGKVVSKLVDDSVFCIKRMKIDTKDGRELRSFCFKDEDQSQEVRGVERGILLETLAKQLPTNLISFNSGLAKIEKSESNETLLELQNGTKLAAKIVIGCDGIRSRVASWMGYREPKFVGQCAFRGLGYYPEGHSYEPEVHQIYGSGIRCGYVPLSPTKVYWFICFNSRTLGPKITDPSVLKKQALDLAKDWPEKLIKTINLTPEDTIIKSPLMDRWLWPTSSPSASSKNIALVGDAWHPMTPNLAQGACCALEDSVVLSKKIAKAVKSGEFTVAEAIRSYESERWPRIFPLTVRANVVGAFLQWDNPVVCSVRNNVIVPKLVRLGVMLDHTNFGCEPLVC